MITIYLKEVFKTDYITRDAGARLRKNILEEMIKDKKVTVDFSDMKIASTAFFDEGIVKLNEGNISWSRVKELLILKNLYQYDKKLLLQIASYRNLDFTNLQYQD